MGSYATPMMLMMRRWWRWCDTDVIVDITLAGFCDSRRWWTADGRRRSDLRAGRRRRH